MTREREPLSSDMLVELALAAAGAYAVWYIVTNAGELARKAGNAATGVITNSLQTAGQQVGYGLVRTVQSIPGLQQYLQTISQPVEPADLAVEVAPGVYEVNGQEFNTNF